MDMEPELALDQLQHDVSEIRHDLEQLSTFIKGNGDPTKGLLWLVADLGRLVASQALIVATNQTALKEHQRDEHYRRQSVWGRVAFGALSQAAGTAVLVLAFLIILGFLDYVRSGRIP
jgi:hypothetical protein